VAPRRLRAHLLMLLRRGQAVDGPSAATPSPAGLQVSGWTLDRVHNRLLRGERCVELTELQAGLLQVLIADLGRVVPRGRLIEGVARGRDLHARSVDVYVARLRQRLRDERVDDLHIDGVRGRGYMLAPGKAAGNGSRDGCAAAPPDLLHWLAPVVPAERALA
jgi:DNA-binding response OmpR family regulator